MSHSIVNQIRRLPIKNPAKAVLWVIADIADDSGYAYPSHATIAIECGVTDRTVINCIQQLEACGVLVANRTNGRHTTYTITPENFTQIEPNPRTTFTPERRSPLNDVHHTPEPRSLDPRTTFTPERRSPLNDVHHTPEPRSLDPRTTFTIPLNDVHTNPHKPPYNPQLTPSVTAHEGDAENQVTPKTKKPKSEKTGLTIGQMIESLPELSESVARDFLAYRKTKKSPLTETAWKYIAKEITKALAHGYTPDDALAEAMVAGWQGVKAEWLANRNKSKPTTQATWADQQNDKWGAFLDGTTNPSPKTVSGDNVIPFAALEMRHG